MPCPYYDLIRTKMCSKHMFLTQIINIPLALALAIKLHNYRAALFAIINYYIFLFFWIPVDRNIGWKSFFSSRLGLPLLPPLSGGNCLGKPQKKSGGGQMRVCPWAWEAHFTFFHGNHPTLRCILFKITPKFNANSN